MFVEDIRSQQKMKSEPGSDNNGLFMLWISIRNLVLFHLPQTKRKELTGEDDRRKAFFTTFFYAPGLRSIQS